MVPGYTINVNGWLMDFDKPMVMGIVNITSDSFFSLSRSIDSKAIEQRIRQLVNEGADIIDVGACSTRPGARLVDEDEEMARMRTGLETLRSIAPEAVLSVDTFRSSVARMAVEEFGAAIVNDVSGGGLDEDMFKTVAELGVAYVLTWPGKLVVADGQLLQNLSVDNDTNILEDAVLFFSEKINQLRALGQKDIIIDPGFGFGKTLGQNFQLLRQLGQLRVFGLPVLVGVSRKSMIYKTLETTPEDALNGTTVLHALCLHDQTADILRVHDVRQCREAIKLWEAYNG